MNNNYATLIIKDNNVIEFEATISLEPEFGKQINIIKDIMGYQEMINELLHGKYKESTKTGYKTININENLSQDIPVYKEKLIQIKTMDQLIDFLIDKGFDCEVINNSDNQDNQVELRMMDKSITDKYKPYKSPDGIIRSCSIARRAQNHCPNKSVGGSRVF